MQPTIEEIKDLIETSLKYYSLGMGCGLEDLGITDRYEAMEYGYNKAIEGILELLNTKYDIVEEGYTQQLQDDGSVLNKPIYVLQKSSQSREVQEESTSPTESEKKDFGKKIYEYLVDEGVIQEGLEFYEYKFMGDTGIHRGEGRCKHCGFHNTICKCKHNRLIHFLSSNGYL